MIELLIWTIRTVMSSVPKKANKLNLSLSLLSLNWVIIGWLVASLGPSHYLSQRWLIVNWTLMNIFCEIWIKMQWFLLKKTHINMSFAEWRPFFPQPEWVEKIMIFYHRLEGQRYILYIQHHFAEWKTTDVFWNVVFLILLLSLLSELLSTLRVFKKLCQAYYFDSVLLSWLVHFTQLETFYHKYPR